MRLAICQSVRDNLGASLASRLSATDFYTYAKCLFQSINYAELQSELAARAVRTSPSDSSYMLRLKLRRDILVSVQALEEIIIKNTSVI